jgi:hypothetical protein
MALEAESLDVVTHGIRAAIRTSRFFPRPVEILELGGERPVDAAWVNQQLSAGISGRPVGAFVQMFVARLGGWRAVEDRLPLDRLRLVQQLYPGILAAFRARQLPVPTEGSVAAAPNPARKQLATAADFPTPKELRTLVETADQDRED